MKRVVIVVKDEEGKFEEQVHFVKTLKEAKLVTGFMAVVKQDSVKRPSLRAMCEVLHVEYGVNLDDFCDKCYRYEKYHNNVDTNLNSDAIIPASNLPKNRSSKA